MLQQEIPIETNYKILKVAKDKGIMTILDPGPPSEEFKNFPDYLKLVDFLTPNKHEAEFILGKEITGEELEADIIVTATGLNLVTLGEVDFKIDGTPVDFSQTWIYKGLAYSDVPNLISTFGYINASWTLRADINSSYACRVLNHMRKTGAQKAPRLRESDMDMPQRDWIEGFSSGYMKRSMSEMPKQGDREPWLNTQDFYKDKKMLSRNTPIEDGVMEFAKIER